VRLSPSLKLGLIAFLAVDLALAFILGSLYILRADLRLKDELRDIGATIYEEAFVINKFELLDQDANLFTLDDLRGDWNLIFFGFTSCPDICPITMSELKRFADVWFEAGQKKEVNVILATVDPNNDDPSSMKEYLGEFNSSFLGLTGTQVELKGLAESLFVGFGESMNTEVLAATAHDGHSKELGAARFSIDHSSHISVINPEAELFAVIRPPHRAHDLVQALELIIEKY